MGLAFPYPKFYGELIMPDDYAVLNHDNLDSNSSIKRLAIEISHNPDFTYKPKFDQFLEDALCGLYFDSNIPSNYGLGSSGALVASIYAKYFAPENIDLKNSSQIHQIQHELAAFESFYHGNSSGTDPLISFLNKALLIHTPLQLEKLPTVNKVKFLLIDTKKQSSTKSYMQVFEQISKVKPNTVTDLIHYNNESIIALLKNDDKSFETISRFCEIEQEILNEMFEYPSELASVLNTYNQSFNVKLCGSGGGGYLIGIVKAKNYDTVLETLSKNNISFQDLTLPNVEVINT